MGHILFPKVLHFWRSCIRFSQDLKSLVPMYKSSASFFGMSPKLAVVIYGAGKWAADSNFPNGCVIHLSHNSYLILRILCNAGVNPCSICQLLVKTWQVSFPHFFIYTVDILSFFFVLIRPWHHVHSWANAFTPRKSHLFVTVFH